MAKDKLTAKSFTLLEDIKENNNKDWYHDHKDDFESYVREPFAEILKAASDKLDGTKTPFIGHEKTMFRQHRDVRFSKDKSPYKTAVSGLMSPSGTKDESGGFIYVQVDAEGGFMASGKYKLDAKALEPIRKKIIEKDKEFDAVLKNLHKAGLDFMEEETLKSMPRGFSDYDDHKHAQYLKLTSIVVKKDLPKQRWLDGDVKDELAWMAQNCSSLLDFLDI